VQAKLPDINHIWIRWRNYGIQCIDQKNYKGSAGAVMEMNALFTDDYRIEISTKKYEQLRANSIMIVCPKCSEQYINHETRKFDLLLPHIDSVLANQKTKVSWQCSKCKNINFLSDSKIIATELQNPFYFKVIRDPPERHGTIDRMGWHEKWQVWFFNAMEELEHQLGRYRAEYQAQEESGEMIEEGSENAD